MKALGVPRHCYCHFRCGARARLLSLPLWWLVKSFAVEKKRFWLRLSLNPLRFNRETRVREMIEHTKIVKACVERLATRYTVDALLLGGSAAMHPERALDADVCAVVRQDVIQRARIEVAGISVDLFVCGKGLLERNFKNGRADHHLVRLFAAAEHLHGDKSVSDALQAQARVALRSPAPASSKQSAFAHCSRPFNLLRKFQDVRLEDSPTAGLIVAELVHSCVEAYFALNRLWTVGIRERISVIAAHNPQGADALRLVIQTPLPVLCSRPEILETMVRLLVGEELAEEDIWLT